MILEKMAEALPCQSGGCCDCCWCWGGQGKEAAAAASNSPRPSVWTSATPSSPPSPPPSSNAWTPPVALRRVRQERGPGPASTATTTLAQDSVSSAGNVSADNVSVSSGCKRARHPGHRHEAQSSSGRPTGRAFNLAQGVRLPSGRARSAWRTCSETCTSLRPKSRA